MKILGLCLSSGKGGLEAYALKAISAMQEAGHESHFALSPNGIQVEQNARVKLLRLSPRLRKLPVLSARRMAKYIDANQIDIIHMHWNKDLTLAVLAKCFSRRKPKLVYSRHMEITRSKKDIYHRALYSQVDCMLVNAKFVLEQAIRYLPMPRQKIKLLYLGVAANPVADASECDKLVALPRNRNNSFLIGMVGRIEYGKGQHVLIEALAILQQRGVKPVVLMAGPIMDTDYYHDLMRQVSDKNLSDNVKYLGVANEPQKLMSCCDVVVLTTFCETFGLVLVEAMRVGTAVIGSNAGGVPEIIKHEDTGMLYDSGDAGQLADCIARLMQDEPGRNKIAESGKQYADKMFNADIQFQKLAQVLESVQRIA